MSNALGLQTRPGTTNGGDRPKYRCVSGSGLAASLRARMTRCTAEPTPERPQTTAARSRTGGAARLGAIQNNLTSPSGVHTPPYTDESLLIANQSGQSDDRLGAAVAAERERGRLALDRTWQRAESKSQECAALQDRIDSLLHDELPRLVAIRVGEVVGLLCEEERCRISIMDAQACESSSLATSPSAPHIPCVVIAAKDSGLMRQLVSTQRRLADLERRLLQQGGYLPPTSLSTSEPPLMQLSDLATQRYVVVGNDHEAALLASRPQTAAPTTARVAPDGRPTTKGCRRVRTASRKPKPHAEV